MPDGRREGNFTIRKKHGRWSPEGVARVKELKGRSKEGSSYSKPKDKKKEKPSDKFTSAPPGSRTDDSMAHMMPDGSMMKGKMPPGMGGPRPSPMMDKDRLKKMLAEMAAKKGKPAPLRR